MEKCKYCENEESYAGAKVCEPCREGEYSESFDSEEVEERICMACSVVGCDCDSGCLNCGSKDPNHRCD